MELVDLAESSDWQLIKNKDGTKAYIINSEDGLKMVKGEGWINGDIDEGAEMLQSTKF